MFDTNGRPVFQSVLHSLFIHLFHFAFSRRSEHDATGLLRHRGLAGFAKDWAAHASRSPAPRLREAAAYVHQEILQRPLREHSTLVVTESRRLAPVIPGEACSVPALAPSLALAPPLALAAMVRTTMRHRICSHSNSSLRRYLSAGGPFEYADYSATVVLDRFLHRVQSHVGYT